MRMVRALRCGPGYAPSGAAGSGAARPRRAQPFHAGRRRAVGPRRTRGLVRSPVGKSRFDGLLVKRDLCAVSRTRGPAPAVSG